MMEQDIAKALRDAEQNNANIAPIRNHLTDGAAAYRIQDINTQMRLDAGGRLVGRKIGLTNPAVQKQLGVDQPDYGMLFADMEVAHGAEIPWVAEKQMKVEAEIAFILGRDLPNPDASTAEIVRAIDYAMPSLEIVGSRIANWDISFVDTVADNGSSAYFTLGPSPRRIDAIDFLNCKMEMKSGDDMVSQGVGSACLGSPLNAVLWLARVMAAAGRSLKEGDIVLSGALGPMVAVAPGASFTAQIEGLGETSIRFGEKT